MYWLLEFWILAVLADIYETPRPAEGTVYIHHRTYVLECQVLFVTNPLSFGKWLFSHIQVLQNIT